jgi:hypothetical protein
VVKRSCGQEELWSRGAVVERSVVEKSGCDREKRACSPVATRGYCKRVQ